jgi:hypothetical protein
MSGPPSIAGHHSAGCFSTDDCGRDEIDCGFDEMVQVDPYNGDPPSKRKDSELARVLSILDSLEAVRGDG